MKQKDYIKLVVDTTALSTRTKLLQEQLNPSLAEYEQTFATIKEKLDGVKLSIDKALSSADSNGSDETLIAGTTIKRAILSIERDLKGLLENPIVQQNRYIATLQETLQKISTKQEAFFEDGEFDLDTISEQTTNTHKTLEDMEQTLQKMLQKQQELQNIAHSYEKEINLVLLDRKLQETTQKTAALTHEISNIEGYIESSPDLTTKHATQLRPLAQAFSDLMAKTKLLDLTKDLPPASIAEEDNTNPKPVRNSKKLKAKQ